jgi:ADP-heptose:LPS heptosyltransferase
MNTTKIIKQIDQLIGPVLLKLLPKAAMAKSKATPLKKILVIRPGGMGDAFLLLPVLRAVFKKYKVKIDVLCEPRNKAAFLNVDFISSIYFYRNLKSWWTILHYNYDLIIDTEQSHFLSAVMTRILKADLKIGFKTNGRDKMHNISLPYEQEEYEASLFWNLFTLVFDINPEISFDFPYFEQTEPLVNGNDFVCFFPGASIKPKLWPEERWAKIIDWVAHKGFKPILLGSFLEKNQCSKIMSLLQNNKTSDMCCKLSIPETANLFKRAKVLISTDSSILHLGVLCNIPTISLFGPTSERKWAPKGNRHIIVKKTIECRPCTLFGTTPPCSNNLSCMTQISVNDVLMGLKNVFK